MDVTDVGCSEKCNREGNVVAGGGERWREIQEKLGEEGWAFLNASGCLSMLVGGVKGQWKERD